MPHSNSQKANSQRTRGERFCIRIHSCCGTRLHHALNLLSGCGVGWVVVEMGGGPELQESGRDGDKMRKRLGLGVSN